MVGKVKQLLADKKKVWSPSDDLSENVAPPPSVAMRVGVVVSTALIPLLRVRRPVAAPSAVRVIVRVPVSFAARIAAGDADLDVPGPQACGGQHRGVVPREAKSVAELGGSGNIGIMINCNL